MEKRKQSKKRWAWTEAQRRKHQTSNPGWYSVPKWYCRLLNKENKACEKAYLKKIMKGDDPDFVELEIKNQASSAGYSWW
jgi:hypothetical protein